MMRRVTISIFVCILLSGCVSAKKNVDPDVAGQIPQGAEAIHLYSDKPPQDLYRDVYQSLAREGFVIAESNEEMGTLSTEYTDIGQSTTVSINAFVEENESGSVATLRGKWGVTGSFGAGMSAAMGAGIESDMGEPARWVDGNRAGVAFGQMVMVAKDIPHERIEYE